MEIISQNYEKILENLIIKFRSSLKKTDFTLKICFFCYL